MRVALLVGGKSTEREVSLKGGKAVYKAILELGYKVEVFDTAIDLPKLAQKAKDLDVAFILVHGAGGEDGSLQGFLDLLELPYQGAGILGSALALHKGLSKLLYQKAGLPVPKGKTFTFKDSFSKIKEYARFLGYPLIVKPATQGSSVGLALVEKEEDLKPSLEKAWEIDKEILLEEYLRGRELTVGILEEKPLPVVEIIPQAKFFNYETKYTPGLAKEICPAPISEELTQKAQNYALKAHKALYLRHYSRTDMILVENEIFVLETNTIPGMTETSLLPLSAKVYGYEFKDLIKKLIDLALRNKKK